MEKLLKLITDGEALSTEQMGKILGLTRDELDAEFQKLIDANILLGWRAVLNPDVDDSMVHAAIELRINPERDGGFDKLAQRISKFDQVDSCFLMSGAYDLLLFVKAKSLRGVASFVYEKLATNRRGHIHGNAFLSQDIQTAGVYNPKRFRKWRPFDVFPLEGARNNI